MLRPVPLKYYLDTIESLGFDARDALAETKINTRKIGDSDYLIGVGQYLRVFENISRFSNLVGFGLDIGSRSELAHFGLLASVTSTCKSARQSMEMVWERFGEDMGLLTRPHFLHGDAKTLAVELKTPPMAQAAYRLCVEDALCKIKKLGALVTGEKIAFQHIFLSYPTPSYVSRYREMFQCPLSFDMPQTIAIVQRSALEKSLSTNDVELHNYYVQHLNRIHQQARANSPVIDRVREYLFHRDNFELPSKEIAARNLGISTRTLSRSLKLDGSSYRKLVEEVWLERAMSCVASGEVSIKEVAFRAGYRDVNAFRRAFKKWTGKTFGQVLASQKCPDSERRV